MEKWYLVLLIMKWAQCPASLHFRSQPCFSPVLPAHVSVDRLSEN